MFIHAGVETIDTTVHVLYRAEKYMMTGKFMHDPSKDEARSFMGVDRDKEAEGFLRGLYAAAFLMRESQHKLNMKLGFEGNTGP